MFEIGVSQAGLDPEFFWNSTPKEVSLKCNYTQFQLEQFMRIGRNIEFATYNSVYNFMTGKKTFKKIKKPSDIYKLPSDSSNEKPLSPDQANKALLESGLVKK